MYMFITVFILFNSSWRIYCICYY